MVECECCNDIQKNGNRIGFNRYMVECECNSLANLIHLSTVLIDTWWNVNLQSLQPNVYTSQF